MPEEERAKRIRVQESLRSRLMSDMAIVVRDIDAGTSGVVQRGCSML